MKKYTYYFPKMDLKIEADNGREAEEIYRASHNEWYSGVIEVTNNIKGYTNKLLPIKWN